MSRRHNRTTYDLDQPHTPHARVPPHIHTMLSRPTLPGVRGATSGGGVWEPNLCKNFETFAETGAFWCTFVLFLEFIVITAHYIFHLEELRCLARNFAHTRPACSAAYTSQSHSVPLYRWFPHNSRLCPFTLTPSLSYPDSHIASLINCSRLDSISKPCIPSTQFCTPNVVSAIYFATSYRRQKIANHGC